jgi:hypothetical protein
VSVTFELSFDGTLQPYDAAVLMSNLPVLQHRFVDGARETYLPDQEAEAPSQEAMAEAVAGIAKEMISSVDTEAPWPSLPLYHAQWRHVTDTEAEGVGLTFAIAMLQKTLPPGRALALRACSLPFYAEFQLIEAVYEHALDSDTQSTSLVTLLTNGETGVLLDGTFSPLDELNQLDGTLNLANAEIAAAYIKFFLAIVHNEEGPLTIVESMADLQWSGQPPEEIDQLANLISPVTHVSTDDDGVFVFTATIVYEGSLLPVQARVQPTGQVQMAGGNALASGL